MRPQTQLPPQQTEPKFDLATHKRDKYGKVVEINPYRLHIIEGQRAFERPINSGNLWYENNQPMGRLKTEFNEKTKKKVFSIELGAPHIEYVPPPTTDQVVAQEISATKQENESLKQELAALKAESEAEKKAMEERLSKLEQLAERRR